MDDIPHIALPIRLSGLAYETNQEGTNDEVAACVAAVVGFPIGYREEAPDFGITDPSFSTRPIDTEEIETACETYEPRASIEVRESAYDARNPLASEIYISVQVFATEDE